MEHIWEEINLMEIKYARAVAHLFPPCLGRVILTLIARENLFNLYMDLQQSKRDYLTWTL